MKHSLSLLLCLISIVIFGQSKVEQQLQLLTPDLIGEVCLNKALLSSLN